MDADKAVSKNNFYNCHLEPDDPSAASMSAYCAVLPALEAPWVQESAARAARLLRLASSLLVPDFGAPEAVLGRRRAAAPRAEGALLAILRRHGADEGVVAEACGVVERL